MAAPAKETKVVRITVEGYNDGKYGRSVIADDQWYGKARAYKGELLEKGSTYDLTIFENKGYLNYVKAEEIVGQEIPTPTKEDTRTIIPYNELNNKPLGKPISKGKPDVQRLIVRQNALTNAVVFENARKGSVEDVVSTLEKFASTVLEEEAIVQPLDAGIPTNSAVDKEKVSTPNTSFNPLDRM